MLEQYAGFFTASSQASAALVGLLFVVLSLDNDLEKDYRIKRYTISETAFISLGGIFVISLLALLPSGLLPMIAASIILAVGGSWVLLGRSRRYASTDLLSSVDVWFGFMTIGSYLVLVGTSLWLMIPNAPASVVSIFCIFITVLFALSLVRAWRTLLITTRKPK